MTESESEPEAHAEPEPAAATAQPSPPWEPPDTFSERFSRRSAKLLRFLTVSVSILFLIGVVLWAIPSIVVASSAEYAMAKQAAQDDRGLSSYLGGPLVCERLPSRYVLRDDGGSFAFVVSGNYGRALMQMEVKDGEVVTRRVHYAIDSLRPLEGQLPSLRRE